MTRQGASASGALILTLEQDGKNLELDRGDEIRLCLRENPTTGYRWAFTADGLDVAEDSFAEPAEGSTGAGGTRTLRLAASRAGAASLSATLQRSWEGPGNAVDRCAFHFNVS